MRMIRILLCAVAALVPCNLFCDDKVPAIIDHLSGPVFWKQSKDSPQVPLKETDVAKKVFAEERLKCDAGATLTVIIYDKLQEIRCPSGWFPIPSVSPQIAKSKIEAATTYGRGGGRDRSQTPGVFAPADYSEVQIGKFDIRWNRGVAMKSFSLVALEGQAKEIWKETFPSADATGRFSSKSANDALLKYRQEVGDGTLILKWENAAKEKGYVRFSILMPEEEARLQADLTEWEKEPEGLLRRLGRASVFDRHKMFSEAAEEYEAALKIAPKGHDLILRTAEAHRRTGNYARQEELTKLIQ
jgi:hypothetical protein